MKRGTTEKKRRGRNPARMSVATEARRFFVLTALTAGATRAEAAAKAGITTRSLDNYTADPAFRIELEQARRRAFDDGLGVLRGAVEKSVQTLIALLRSKREAERRHAASEILSFAFRAWDGIDLESRIAALEKRIAEIKRDGAGAENVN